MARRRHLNKIGESQRKVALILAILIIPLSLWGNINTTFAYDSGWNDTLENYNTGSINPNPGWSVTNAADVVSTPTYRGNRAIGLDGSTAEAARKDVTTTIEATDETKLYFTSWIYFDDTATSVSFDYQIGETSSGYACEIEFNADYTYDLRTNSAQSATSTYATSTWLRSQIEFNYETEQCRARVGTDNWTLATTYSNATSFNWYRFNKATGDGRNIYIDDITLSTNENVLGQETGSETVNFNFPKDYVSPNPINPFSDWQIQFNNFGAGNNYIFQIRAGTASTTINSATTTCTSWDSCKEFKLNTQVGGSSGYVYIPTGFLNPLELDTTSNYYWKIYLYDNNILSQTLLTSSTISYAYTFLSTSTTNIIDTSNPHGEGSIYFEDFEYDPTTNTGICNQLGNKFPFAYFCDITDVFETLTDDGGDELPTLTVNLGTMAGTTTVISKTIADDLFGSSNITLVKTLITAMLYIGLGLYYYTRIKGLFSKNNQ